MGKKNSQKQEIEKENSLTAAKLLQQLKEDLSQQQLIAYDLFPNIELYMDQIISLMAQQADGEKDKTSLTPSMVNNYVKQGVLPRASGKRYTRDHLVDLTLLVSLKEVLPITAIGRLRGLLEFEGDSKWRYEQILANSSEAKQIIRDLLPADQSAGKELSLQILKLGLISSLSRQIALDLLDFLGGTEA